MSFFETQCISGQPTKPQNMGSSLLLHAYTVMGLCVCAYISLCQYQRNGGTFVMTGVRPIVWGVTHALTERNKKPAAKTHLS